MDRDTVLVMLAMALILLSCVGANCLWNYAVCEQVKTGSELAYRWQFFGGCLVQTPSGAWVPWNNYLGIEGRK